MADGEILGRIDDLIAEEHELRSRSVGVGLNGDDQSRLTRVEQELDQCWDLLRQRRAKTEFHENPEEAQVRSVGEVEGYRQ
ncbi:DUF2630 family protein [Amycolatopsis sp. FDAARGOS 1241]|uniref:DUF2630 family protein n=1 Tax=Amycolatopsis sp. FDAARGOS 1241 TaxID=2778070 RepID=UPI00194DDE21|nr:DUF2630 family protein [Amycolatopsis sp. FDAARGOS 1241]QRP43875.1 DUF2630 family protein [Amycolatopsis sp. FDAARGOS 1241]